MRIQFILTVVTGFLENLLFAGILFGWPPMEYVLIKEGYFSEQCHSNHSSLVPCDRQAASLNLVYYMGVIAISFTGLPLGYFLDRFGTWKTRTVACAFMTFGSALLVGSTANLPWLVYPGMFIFVTGSIGTFITNPQTANFFPQIRALIVNMLDGMLASSATVCLIIKIAYAAGYKFQNMLIFFMSLTLLPWIRTYTLMPRRLIPYPFKDQNFRYGIFEWFSKDQDNEALLLVSDEETKTNIPKEKRPSNFKNILFWTNTYQFAMYALRNIFFDGSLDDWLQVFITDNHRISNLINLYTFLVFFSFIISIVSGLIVDSFTNFHSGSKALYFGLLASSIITSLIMICLSIGVVIENPIMSFVFSFVGQGFVYGTATTFFVYVFPMEDFGKVYGFSIFIGGIFMASEFAFFKLSLMYDPTFITANYVFLALSVSTLIHPFVWAKRGLNFKLST